MVVQHKKLLLPVLVASLNRFAWLTLAQLETCRYKLALKPEPLKVILPIGHPRENFSYTNNHSSSSSKRLSEGERLFPSDFSYFS